MIELTGLEVYSSLFYLTEENNIFELYKFPDSENPDSVVFQMKVTDEIEKDLETSRYYTRRFTR